MLNVVELAVEIKPTELNVVMLDALKLGVVAPIMAPLCSQFMQTGNTKKYKI